MGPYYCSTFPYFFQLFFNCGCVCPEGIKVPLKLNEKRSDAKIAISSQIKSNCIFSLVLKSLEYETDSWKLTACVFQAGLFFFFFGLIFKRKKKRRLQQQILGFLPQGFVVEE